MTLRIEIRDKRLRGGRLSISARTTRETVRRKREALVRLLLDQGDYGAIERLRAGEIHFSDIQRAVRKKDFESLRRPAETVDLGQMMERVLQIVEATRSDGTLRQYQIVTRQLLAELGEGCDPSEVTTEDARQFLHRPRVKGRPWSPKKQEQAAGILGRAWRLAIQHEAELAKKASARPRLVDNPWYDVELPEVRSTRHAFLQPTEWMRLANENVGVPALGALGVGCLAGLRASEVRYLRTDVDLDLKGRRIRVQPREGEWDWVPKTDNSIRDLYIGDELLRILVAHREAGFAGDRFFFRTPGRDRPMSESTLLTWTSRSFARAGIAYGRDGDGLTFHSLRHTFASWLVQRDVQLKKVAKLLGNTTDEVDRTYGHLLPDDLDQAVELVSDISTGVR